MRGRKTFQYFLACGTTYALVTTPLFASVLFLYMHREQPLEEVLTGPTLLRLAFSSLIGLAALRYRRVLLDAIDRRFLVERIQRPPGFGLRVFANFLCSRKTFELVLEPTLRDLYDEYCQALLERRPWKARWVRIRGYLSFWSAVFAQAPISVIKMVYQIWKAIP